MFTVYSHTYGNTEPTIIAENVDKKTARQIVTDNASEMAEATKLALWPRGKRFFFNDAPAGLYWWSGVVTPPGNSAISTIWFAVETGNSEKLIRVAKSTLKKLLAFVDTAGANEEMVENYNMNFFHNAVTELQSFIAEFAPESENSEDAEDSDEDTDEDSDEE